MNGNQVHTLNNLLILRVKSSCMQPSPSVCPVRGEVYMHKQYHSRS